MAMTVIRVAGLAMVPELRHGFSTRLGGVSAAYGDGELNLGMTREDDAAAVRANRLRLAEALGGGELRAVRQVHSARVVEVKAGETLDGVEADGMVTAAPGVLLGVLAADCVPVLVADRRLRVAGAFHAGWRGTAAGVVGVGVAMMGELYGCRGEDLVAAVGPAIGSCCYTVGAEVRERFAADLFAGDRLDRLDRLDLWEANRRQLVEAGVGRVEVVGECTACARTAAGGRKYFSHRADAGRTGRGMGVIGWA